MKKILTALVAVAFLAGPAFAAEDQAAKDAGKAAADQQRVEETHTHTAKKKSKKAKKAKADAPKADEAAAPAPAPAPAK